MAKSKVSRGTWRRVNGANVLVGSGGKIYAGRKAIEAYAKGDGEPSAARPHNPITLPEIAPGEPWTYKHAEHLTETYGDFVNVVKDKDQLDALLKLRGGGYSDVNSDLRADKPNATAQLANEAIANFPPLQEDYTLYRGMKLKGEALAAIVPGAEIVHKGFPHASTSSSVARGGNFAGNVEFQIRARKGDRALVLTGGESEITYAAGTTFKVISVSEVGTPLNPRRIAIVDPLPG